jgi:hypothetical protein
MLLNDPTLMGKPSQSQVSALQEINSCLCSVRLVLALRSFFAQIGKEKIRVNEMK